MLPRIGLISGAATRGTLSIQVMNAVGRALTVLPHRHRRVEIYIGFTLFSTQLFSRLMFLRGYNEICRSIYTSSLMVAYIISRRAYTHRHS